jgi:hypothetical protein
MSRQLLFSASAIAVMGVASAAGPARAQVVVPDASIEGPIQSVDATPGSGLLGGVPVNWVGEMQVMGVKIRVLGDAPLHSPTASVTIADIAGVGNPLPGRTQDGFVGGTAIVTGDSSGSVIYATDVFVEAAENVILGEATMPANGNVTVNDVEAVRLLDPRMPAGLPINGFGFEINTTSIAAQSPLSLEGYFAGGKLYYHTLEADGGTLARPTTPEVSVLRAQCRVRGGNRDELEVRGGTHTPAGTAVTIEISDSTVTTAPHPGQWRILTPTAAPIVDNTVTPAQGLYRFNRTNLNLPGSVCPAFVRASILNHTVHSDPLAPDSR